MFRRGKSACAPAANAAAATIPRWALPVLLRMVEVGQIETDSLGHYRIKPVDARGKKRRWISPDIAKILRQSGRNFDGASVTDLDAPDDT
jgi:hypothetical protein